MSTMLPEETKRRLLILDDDLAVGQTIGFVAEELGFEVKSFTLPEPFFRAVDAWQPTHIAIDLVMPEMDGVEAMRVLAERNCAAKIIITSGVGSRVLDSARRTAAALGLRDVCVMPKPFSMTELRQLLSTEPVPRAIPPTKEDRASSAFEVTSVGLLDALEQRQFLLAYQPKVDCVTGALAGFEALARWVPSPPTVVMPDRFVPVAESSGLIDALTEQLFEQGLRWLSESFPSSSISLSLNISAKGLADVHLGERLSELCHVLTIDPARVTFELTESSAMDDPVKSLALLTRLRMKGFQLSIDDFGTGFSSMVQLVRLPFSEIKVDKSFVMTAMGSHEALTVVKSIVDLGKGLGLRVVAEGVEDAKTLDLIASLGCDFAQGYFIARPMSGEAATAWAANHGI